ncbi:MAG: Uma2 family endonuclease [Gemmataceae bacterium]|nr:Uma2 family endonuclease [Gemmataceae bacterium]
MSTATPGVGAAKKLMTADEFWEFVHRPENQDRDFELIRGEVVEVSRPRKPHGSIVIRLGSLLDRYAEGVGHGYVVTESGLVLTEDPDTVVGQDVAYYTDADTFDDLNPKWGDVPPILVAEVRSPTDRPNALIARMTEYISNGVKIAWLIDPEDRDVSVFRPGQSPVVLRGEQELTGGDDLPGLAIKVADIFKLPGERAGTPPASPSTPPPSP